MEPNLSTSSSDSPPRRVLPWFLLVALVWASYLGLAPLVSTWMGERFGGAILAITKGRILDPSSFAHGRLRDAAFLLTVAIALGVAASHFGGWVLTRVTRTWAWLPLSTIWFVALNVFLAAAGTTGLWWMMVHAAHPNLQLTAFHIERILMEEGEAPTRVVVLGSSQGQSEIATGELNSYGLPNVQTANLSYAGAAADDLPLVREHYQEIRPQVLVIYLSPINLYGSIAGTRWTPLLKGKSLSYLWDTGVPHLAERARILQGVLGLGIPMIKQRSSFGLALFGTVAEQGYRRPGQPGSTKAKAETEAKKYDPPEEVRELQRRVLLEFLKEEAAAGRQILVIDGELHPYLTAALAPGVMAGYRSTIAAVSALHENITVVRDEVPRHRAEEYSDLYHIYPEARTVFSRAVADVLQDKLGLPMETSLPASERALLPPDLRGRQD